MLSKRAQDFAHVPCSWLDFSVGERVCICHPGLLLVATYPQPTLFVDNSQDRELYTHLESFYPFARYTLLRSTHCPSKLFNAITCIIEPPTSRRLALLMTPWLRSWLSP